MAARVVDQADLTLGASAAFNGVAAAIVGFSAGLAKLGTCFGRTGRADVGLAVRAFEAPAIIGAAGNSAATTIGDGTAVQ